MMPREKNCLVPKKRSQPSSPRRTMKNPNHNLSPIKKRNNPPVIIHQQDHLARRKTKKSRRTPKMPVKRILMNTTISVNITDRSWNYSIQHGRVTKFPSSLSWCGERKWFQARNCPLTWWEESQEETHWLEESTSGIWKERSRTWSRLRFDKIGTDFPKRLENTWQD